MKVIIDGVQYRPVIRPKPAPTIPEAIRRIRKHHGMSYSQFAEKVGCNRSQIWAIEHGQNGIGLKVLCRIMRYFGLMFEEIVNVDEFEIED